MKHILLIISLVTLIIEESVSYAHPFMLTVPTDYFDQPELSVFLLVTLLTFGVGQALIALLLRHHTVTLKMIAIILIAGLLDKWLFSSSGYVLSLGIGLLLAHFMHRSWMGYTVLGIGILLLAIPLVILYFPSETFMDAARFQDMVTIYKSNHYVNYVLNSLTHDYLWLVVTAVFIVWPLLIIDISRLSYPVVIGIILISLGTMLKTAIVHSESVLVFSLFMLIGGLLQAFALYIILKGTARLAVVPALVVSSLLLLFAFTGLGIGDYKNIAINTVLIWDAVIIVIVSLLYFVLYFTLLRKKHVNY